MTPLTRAALKHGVPQGALSASPRAVYAARLDAACELYEAGYTAPEIGALFQVSHTSVLNMLRSAGVQRRSRGGDQRSRPKRV